MTKEHIQGDEFEGEHVIANKKSESKSHFYDAKVEKEVEEILGNDSQAKWVMKMLGKVQDESEHLSIYRVPNKLRKVKDEAYNPHVVSIGPFHRDNPDLIAMKDHKWRYMLFLFQQTDNVVTTTKCLKECTDAFFRSELHKGVCESYAEDLTKIDEHELEKIMLVDGCFILELFLRYHQSRSEIPLDNPHDPIFSSAWMIPTLRHDLALLENQIPFFILEKLYGIIWPYVEKRFKDNKNYKPPNSVTSLALKFFQPMYQEEKTQDTDTVGHVIELGGTDCKHLLHLLHNFFRPSPGQADASKKKKKKFKYCASDLYDTGIQFEIGSTQGTLSSITFHDGVIKIPPLVIDDNTDSLFRNLIAFEQCHIESTHHITSYVILMNSLIRSKEDIKLLKKKGIIHASVAGGKYYVDFESILDHINLRDFCFGELCDNVNEYSKFQRNKLRET